MTNFLFEATPRDTTVDIGNGLIMRWSTCGDATNVANLVGECFRWSTFLNPMPIGVIPDGVIPGPHEAFSAAAKRLLSGKNATMMDRDYALVEDTKRRKTGKNPIVACVSLHRTRAYYGCVDLFFGKPELVASDPEYRNRGLIRRLILEMIHPESEARGDALQFIPGIPHFYRQFGYEYALSSYTISKIESVNQKIPVLARDKTEEPFLLRKATPKDIPYLVSMSTKENASPYTQVGMYYGPEYWQYTVSDIHKLKHSEGQSTKRPRFCGIRDTHIVVNVATGRDVGFTIVSEYFGMKLEALALEETVIVEDALYPILRQLIANKTRDLESLKNYLSTEDAATINTNSISILLQIHPEHPAVRLLNPLMVPASQDPEFRYYVRIVDYPQFIRTVTPELERRLECSPMAGTTGRLRLDFYRKVEGNVAKGLEIIIEKGKIVEAQHWTNLGYQANAEEYLAWKEQGKVPVIYTAAFAPLTFNTLLLGERSLNDLMWSYGETLVKNEESKLLLNALFPKVSQHIDTVYY